MLLALLAFPLHAAEVAVWSYDDFANGQEISGTDGWASGFDDDPWYGYRGESTNWAYPNTDRNSDDRGADGDWGEGGALDNFLVNEAEPVGDGRFEAYFYTEDDDTLGLVIGQQDSGNYYLFVFCGAEWTDGSCPFDLSGSAIVKIARGEATILDETEQGYDAGDYGLMSFQLDDGVLTAMYEDGEVVLEAEDTTFTSVDAVGFYSYDSGNEDGSWTGFADPVLYAIDEDDDGVIDDDDACEEDAATGPDADGDGCTDGTEPGDTDTDTDADTDTDTDSDTDTDTDTDTDADTDTPGGNTGGGLTAAGACACDSGTSAAVGLLPMLLAFATARRRRL